MIDEFVGHEMSCGVDVARFEHGLEKLLHGIGCWVGHVGLLVCRVPGGDGFEAVYVFALTQIRTIIAN